MTISADQEIKAIDHLKACLAQRPILAARIENGSKFCANLLLETDAENPKYQLHKGRLEHLQSLQEANELSIWEFWKSSNAKVEFEIPKIKGLEYPFMGLADRNAEGEFTPRPFRETATSWIYTLTFYEYKKFLAPFLFPDLEVNF